MIYRYQSCCCLVF